MLIAVLVAAVAAAVLLASAVAAGRVFAVMATTAAGETWALIWNRCELLSVCGILTSSKTRDAISASR